MDAIIERDDTGWFDRLCREKGYEAAPPKLAGDIVAGDVLWTPTGDPMPVTRVRLYSHSIRIWHNSRSYAWALDTTVTLIARKPS